MTPQELKNSILQLAIQGKLVEQRPDEGTGEELYQQIQAEKQRLIKEGKIKKEKPLTEITEEEIPFDIPESWYWSNIESITYTVGSKENQIQTKDILTEGSFPVVSQGQSLIDGYTNQREKVIDDLPLVMFGDHTRNVKYIDFPFVIGAEGTKFHKCILIYPKFLYYWMIYASGRLRNRGYARHYVLLKQQYIPLPPLAEQKRIVAKIEELLPYVDRYEKAWNELEELNKRFPIDLQKSILQLAVQGKLVEQRPEEGTAEELYQQIKAEKQRLIKEGKIKKEKPLPEITEDEIPFDIPESWKWVRVGNIGSWSAGATPPRTNPQYYYNGDIPWLKTGDLNDGYITEVPEFISNLALEKLSLRLNPIGSVLMAMYGATIGKLGILNIEATTNQACCACIPFEGVYNKYLFYFLMARRKAFIKMGEGGAQPNISKEKIIHALFALPPLAEQKRIVAKIEELLPLCEKLKK